MVSMDTHEHEVSLVHTKSEASVSTNTDMSKLTSNGDSFQRDSRHKTNNASNNSCFSKINNYGNLNLKNIRLNI